MGLFDLFFKSRRTRDGNKPVEGGENGGALAPDPTVFLVPRDRVPIVPLFPRPAISESPGRVADESRPSKPLIVTLGDVIARIPAEFLGEGTPDIRRELRFGPSEYFSDIPRGRVTVALSNIAAQCPEAFRVPITDDADREVRLPLQKVIDQIIGVPAFEARNAPAAESKDSIPLALPGAPVPAAEIVPPPAAESIVPPVDDSGEPVIRLNLAAILAGCPDEAFAGERPSMPESVQIALPFEPIEQQLPGGAAEIRAERLLALVPPPYAGRRFLREGVMIPLPIDEVFRNLPAGVVVARPPVPGSPAMSPAVAEESRRFFVPGPPHLRSVPPPPLLVRPLGEYGSAESPAPLETNGATSQPSTAAAPEPACQVTRPPLARPLVVLPPPLGGSAVDAPVETTSDQTAVLEFLSGGGDAKP